MATAALSIGGAPGPQIIDQKNSTVTTCTNRRKELSGKRQYSMPENHIFFAQIRDQRNHPLTTTKENQRGESLLSLYVSKLAK